MLISPSSADCQGQASVLRHVCWQNGAMTAHAMRMQPVSKPWEELRRSLLRAVSILRCSSGMLVSNPCAMRSSNLLGLCTFQEPWAEAYYQRKRQEGKTHSMAVRALGNVWVRIIYALWSKHEHYQVATFLAAQQAHGRLVA